MGAHLGWGGTGVVERVDPRKAVAWRGQAGWGRGRGAQAGRPGLGAGRRGLRRDPGGLLVAEE